MEAAFYFRRPRSAHEICRGGRLAHCSAHIWVRQFWHSFEFWHTALEDDSLPKARNVCVYILIGANVRHKVFIGYFLIDSRAGSE